MKIVQSKEYNAVFTEQELIAIRDFIGKTSENQRLDIGITRKQSDLLCNMYGYLDEFFYE